MKKNKIQIKLILLKINIIKNKIKNKKKYLPTK